MRMASREARPERPARTRCGRWSTEAVESGVELEGAELSR
jgi:hypothetical protein